MKNPNCDNDKCTDPKGEVRVLPTGEQGNAILCRDCFRHELRFRVERNRELGEGCKFDLPTWDSLKVYKERETLFGEIVAAGIKHASHETDLYIPDTPEARAILDQFPLEKRNARRFRNQVEGGTWIDIPFAYLPAWEAKQKRAN